MRSFRTGLGVLAATALAFTLTTAPALASHGDDDGGSGSSSGGSSKTGDKAPIFDFTDAYYRANGIDPAGLVGRRNGTDGLSVTSTAPDSTHRNVRVTLTLPAYDTSGGTQFFTVLGDLAPTAFTKDAAGTNAKALAEKYTVYVFPTRTGNQTAVTNNRQADMVDLSNGYFSNDPVALWRHVFVSWTSKIDTAAGKTRLADLAKRNGTALDGTPIITSKSDIDSLYKDGYVALLKRGTNETGRYFICPVFKDPRKGAITKDAFLATVRRADGTPLPAEQKFVDTFTSLQAESG